VRTKKKLSYALTLAALFCNAALMVGGPPAFAVSADVVACAQQGSQALGGSAQGQPSQSNPQQGSQVLGGSAQGQSSQSNQGTSTSKASPTAATATATPPPTVECDLVGPSIGPSG
jgi:hypothetical protein